MPGVRMFGFSGGEGREFGRINDLMEYLRIFVVQFLRQALGLILIELFGSPASPAVHF